MPSLRRLRRDSDVKRTCPKCNGQGVLTYELHFLDPVKTICDECEGKRYHQDVLELKYHCRNIAEVLDRIIRSLLAKQNTVVIIEHNRDYRKSL